jgi:hypothetical protein
MPMPLKRLAILGVFSGYRQSNQTPCVMPKPAGLNSLAPISECRLEGAAL